MRRPHFLRARTRRHHGQGRHIGADEIAWLRCRAVGVHAVDLGVEVDFADLPDDFLTALIADVVVRRTANGELATIAAWLTGRGQLQRTLRSLVVTHHLSETTIRSGVVAFASSRLSGSGSRPRA